MAGTQIDPQVVAGAVELACRAPSVHNSQPWHWIARDGELRLFLEPHRAPRATDLTGREALISCGAVLDHLRVAAAAAGWSTDVARFPNPNDLNHLATITWRPAEFVTDAARARADAILRRRTDRLPFAPPPNWAALQPVLSAAVEHTPATVHVLDDSARPQLAEASRLSEVLRRDDAHYQAELQWWTAPFEVSEGVPYSTLPSPAERERVDVARQFPAAGHADRRPEVDHDRSAILVLATPGDTHSDALGCGEALSEILLEATVAGLATCTLSHVTEMEASRAVIRALIGGAGEPQTLIRVGRVPVLGDQPPATPRRPLADVLSFRD